MAARSALMRKLACTPRCWLNARFFSGGEPPVTSYNTLNEDHSIIVCYHPKTPIPVEDSRPFGSSLQRERAANRRRLTPEQIEMAKKLRNEDPFVWTLGTLAKLFEVKPRLISHVAPIVDEVKREEVNKKQEYISRIRYHRRVRYLKKLEDEQQTKLKDALASLDYKFPGKI